MNFEERPCVGVCLKRYTIDEKGQAVRYATKVDIPEEMRLPHFMLADDQPDDEEAGRITTDYKLVLQAVICHRGDSVYSGHYFTFAKMAPKFISQENRDPLDPPPDYEEASWVVFDDIADQRVKYIDDIKEALNANMPYLLLYQIVPMFDTGESQAGGAKPPSYDDYRSSTEAPPSPGALEKEMAIQLSNENYFANSRGQAFGIYNSSPPSIRLSADFDRPERKSSEEGVMVSYPGSSADNSRRPSAVLVGTSGAGSSAITPIDGSPSLTPVEETTAQRLARAASRFTRNKGSRPQSQSAESRLGMSINRLGGLGNLMRSKEAIAADASSTTITNVTTTTSNTISTEKTSAELTGEDTAHLHPQETTPKKGHRRIRSKEKAKLKAGGGEGDQPDRECSVM